MKRPSVVTLGLVRGAGVDTPCPVETLRAVVTAGLQLLCSAATPLPPQPTRSAEAASGTGQKQVGQLGERRSLWEGVHDGPRAADDDANKINPPRKTQYCREPEMPRMQCQRERRCLQKFKILEAGRSSFSEKTSLRK